MSRHGTHNRRKYDGPVIDMSEMPTERQRAICSYAIKKARKPGIYGSALTLGTPADGRDAAARNAYMANLGGFGMWWQEVGPFEAANPEVVSVVNAWIAWNNEGR